MMRSLCWNGCGVSDIFTLVDGGQPAIKIDRKFVRFLYLSVRNFVLCGKSRTGAGAVSPYSVYSSCYRLGWRRRQV